LVRQSLQDLRSCKQDGDLTRLQVRAFSGRGVGLIRSACVDGGCWLTVQMVPVEGHVCFILFLAVTQHLLASVYTRNVAHTTINNEQLYSQCFIGTKQLIEDFVAEVKAATILLRDSPDIPMATKQEFFKNARQAYGRTALCLSGGATVRRPPCVGCDELCDCVSDACAIVRVCCILFRWRISTLASFVR
jgi:hypothetical protein